jgi:hypothetical protein
MPLMIDFEQACNTVLNSKDKVIQEICAQLKAKDVEYSLTVEQQAIDMNNLMATMSHQVCSLLLCLFVCLSVCLSISLCVSLACALYVSTHRLLWTWFLVNKA